MNKVNLNMARLQIALQFVIAISPVFTVPYSLAKNDALSPFSVDRSSSKLPADKGFAPYSSELSTAASAVSNANPAMAGASLVTGHAANTVEQWLNQFGTARVQLNVDDQGNWDNSALDFLAPVYNSKKAMLFTQLGMRAPDGRVTGNLGAGVRTFYLDNWMLGGNVFFDDDFTGKNRRMGLGGEAWTDNLKLSANSYFAITKWHDSRDFDNYYEKPANGYDVRVEGYLPSYPQLGGKLMYEKYFGNDVALFDKDTLQNDPSAVTVGVNYTPVPLITLGVDYKRGQSAMHETTIGANFRYTIGQPWAQQISPAQVVVQRSLAGSRYDLVERNNEIVMQYKKKPVDNVLTDMQITNAKDNSPADGITANIVSVKASTSNGAPASNAVINWTVSGQGKLSTTSSVTDSSGVAFVNVTNQSAEQVSVTATSGAITRSTMSAFTQSVATVDLQMTKNNSQANGSDQNIGRVLVKDANGQLMSGVAIQWKVNNAAIIVSGDNQSNDQGQAEVHFTNSTAGDVSLSVDASGKTASTGSTFTSIAKTSVAVVMAKDGSLADGTAANLAQATVTDNSGKAMPNVTVNWSVTGGAKPTASSSITDANGQATMNFTDLTVESNLTVTATADGQSNSAVTQFVAIPVASVAVMMTKDASAADGSAANEAQATVTDTNGKAMPNVTVNWSVTGGATPTGSSSITDGSGHAVMNFTDRTVEANLTVTANAGGKSGSAATQFVAIPVGTVAVTMTKDNSLAGGTTANVAQATVTDAGGKAMAGVTVNWSITGSATPAANSSLTDENGHATMSFNDNTVEDGLTVTATADGQSGNTTTRFTVKMGDIAVTFPTARTGINVNAVKSGLIIYVNYTGMQVGDQVQVNFVVKGDVALISHNQVLPDHTFATYTVTSADIGNPLKFTVPKTEVEGLEPESVNSLTGTATAVVNSPLTGMEKTGTVSANVDTQA